MLLGFVSLASFMHNCRKMFEKSSLQFVIVHLSAPLLEYTEDLESSTIAIALKDDSTDKWSIRHYKLTAG